MRLEDSTHPTRYALINNSGMKMAKVHKGQQFGEWIIVTDAAIRGGNSYVWGVQKADEPEAKFAIKLLRKDRYQDPVKYKRFVYEVRYVRNTSNPHILPIVDFYLPDKPSDGDRPWYVMPWAEPIETLLQDKRHRVEATVRLLIPIAHTLAEMHALGHAHRDIKPDNLLAYNGGPVLSDFGLVEFPNKKSITLPMERMGPLLYVAPELFADAVAVDAQPGDVYSLAKTLWVLSTSEGRPPPGHLAQADPRLCLSTYCRHKYAAALNQLIDSATRHAPDQRPTMSAFFSELMHWMDLLNAPSKGHSSDQLKARLRTITASHASGYAEKRALVQSADEVYAKLQPGIDALVKQWKRATKAPVERDSDLFAHRKGPDQPKTCVTHKGERVSVLVRGAACLVPISDGTMIGLRIQTQIVTFQEGTIKICVAIMLNHDKRPPKRNSPPGGLVIGGRVIAGELIDILYLVHRTSHYPSIELKAELRKLHDELAGQARPSLERLTNELEKRQP